MVWSSLLNQLSGKVDPDKQNKTTNFTPIFRSDFTTSTPGNEEIHCRGATGCSHGGEHRRRLLELQYDLRRLHVTAHIWPQASILSFMISLKQPGKTKNTWNVQHFSIFCFHWLRWLGGFLTGSFNVLMLPPNHLFLTIMCWTWTRITFLWGRLASSGTIFILAPIERVESGLAELCESLIILHFISNIWALRHNITATSHSAHGNPLGVTRGIHQTWHGRWDAFKTICWAKATVEAFVYVTAAPH